MSDIRDTVISTVYGVCRPERPDLSDHDKPLLADDLDSLDFATVLMALEDKFGISFQDVDVETVGTINSLVTFIERNSEMQSA